MTYADADHWNNVFRQLHQKGEDLDWEGRWVTAHLPSFRMHQIRHVLDLGCGTGNDVLRLAREGFQVTGLDFSAEAIRQGREKASLQGANPHWLVSDMAQPLPFERGTFDAVMSNVALHMFDAATTRSLFLEVYRIVRPGGVFAFHVNSVADAEVRAERRTPTRQLEHNYVLEQDGQTMRFFDESDLRNLLEPWTDVSLNHIEITHRKTGLPFKCVWHGVAIKSTQ